MMFLIFYKAYTYYLASIRNHTIYTNYTKGVSITKTLGKLSPSSIYIPYKSSPKYLYLLNLNIKIE